MSKTDYERGQLYWFEVTLLARGVDPRAASFQDFKIVRVRAANPISACLTARNEHDAALAFDAKRIEESQS